MGLIRRVLIAVSLALILGSCVQSGAGVTVSLRAPTLQGLFDATPPAQVARRARLPLGVMAYLSHHRIRQAVPLSAATTVLAYPAPPIQARSAILVDIDSGRVLYSKDPDRPLPIASTTKITTATLALHHSRLSDLVTVSQRAASVGESTMALVRGERVTVRQLLYGMMLNSGNDAAVALAEHVAGSQERFVGMMNALARALHMRNTHYVTPHGLDTPHHYSSARDLAIISRYALRDPAFRAVVATTSYHIKPTKYAHEHWLASVNRVMYWYPGVDGVKPGDTDAAGLCQVVSVDRDGRRLLAVLLNTPTLVVDIRNLLNFGLHDFRWVQGWAWWDSPINSLSGGSGSHHWTYYFAAGHYIRGLFLSYFNSHGGLQTLGYPRTEQLLDQGRVVQYFQGGELVDDPQHHTVYPADLGSTLARTFAARAVTSPGRERVGTKFDHLYRDAGGRGVLGDTLTGVTTAAGYPAQFFQYGWLAETNGVPHVVSIGDTALRLKGWFPAWGAGDTYSSTMSPALMPPPSRAPPPALKIQQKPARPSQRRSSRTPFR